MKLEKSRHRANLGICMRSARLYPFLFPVRRKFKADCRRIVVLLPRDCSRGSAVPRSLLPSVMNGREIFAAGRKSIRRCRVHKMWGTPGSIVEFEAWCTWDEGERCCCIAKVSLLLRWRRFWWSDFIEVRVSGGFKKKSLSGTGAACIYSRIINQLTRVWDENCGKQKKHSVWVKS